MVPALYIVVRTLTTFSATTIVMGEYGGWVGLRGKVEKSFALWGFLRGLPIPAKPTTGRANRSAGRLYIPFYRPPHPTLIVSW